MVNTDKKYPAKLILFGEYTVIQTGTVLAIPVERFGGSWAYRDVCDQSLVQVAAHLNEIGLGNAGTALLAEVEQGLCFSSDIPTGFGLGSSGALTAAIYDQFVSAQRSSATELKKTLGRIEAHFHGASSGTDPLVSLLGKVVWMDNGEINVLTFPDTRSRHTPFFLLDSGKGRNTSALVATYQKAMMDEDYANALSQYLFRYVDEAIAAYLRGRKDTLFELFHEISHFQFRYFEGMIPEEIRDIWMDGLDSNTFKIKLCGAGGGGYFLGMSKTATEELPFFNPIIQI